MSGNDNQILSAQAVRASTSRVFLAAQQGMTEFQLDLDKLPETADFVVAVVKKKYPDLRIPYHSRWGHFKAQDPVRLSTMAQSLAEFDKKEQARRMIDLVIPSVLLDAGAGPNWKYTEAPSRRELARSEGLGVASFYMFKDGAFSNDDTDMWRSDAEGLLKVTAEDVAKAFQVSESNPLAGLEGRSQLVQSLGKALKASPSVFVGGRPGGLVDYFSSEFGNTIEAEDILKTLLLNMGSIWPGRLEEDGVNLGDVWEHPTLGRVAFHKLSQWLSYSLIEPLEVAGFKVVNLDGLTGLAEYRNGGLFVDTEVITLPGYNGEELAPGDAKIIEWRALTVQLLDAIAPMVRERLKLKAEDFPLAKVLEGGTWWAGRQIAQEKRTDGTPPIKIKSDGTVF